MFVVVAAAVVHTRNSYLFKRSNRHSFTRQQQAFFFEIGTIYHVKDVIQVVLLLPQTTVHGPELLDMLLWWEQFYTSGNNLHIYTQLLANLIESINKYLLRLEKVESRRCL